GIACPANQNTAAAAGGTTLALGGGGGCVSESAWNGGGSGCSGVISAQSWQTSATNWGAIGCGTHRGMADVSADADPATGAAVYDNYGQGGWLVVGGASPSPPPVARGFALAANHEPVDPPAASV